MGKSSSSSSSSSDSSDDEWRNLPKRDKKLRKKWKRNMRKGMIPHGTVAPWHGGPAWYPPAKSGKHCKKGKHGKGKVVGYPGAAPGHKMAYPPTGYPAGPGYQPPSAGYPAGQHAPPAGGYPAGHPPPYAGYQPNPAPHYPTGNYPPGGVPPPQYPGSQYPPGGAAYGQPGAPQGPFQAPPGGAYPQSGYPPQYH